VFGRDIGIDLGTATVLIFVRGKGVVLREPSVVALDQTNDRILAVGEDAKRMLGRTPGHVTAVRPLRDGVIANYTMTEAMLRHFIRKVTSGVGKFFRNRVMICVPSGATDVERRAVLEAAVEVGSREAYLIEEPMAAAIGSGLPVDEAPGQMVVDIGGGTTEVAIISKFAISCSESLRVAGDEANEAICQFIRKQHRMGVSEMMAEVIKMKIGSAVPLKKSLEIKLRGKDLSTGMPKIVTLTDADIRNAIREPTRAIIEAIRRVLEKASPDLASDVAENGIWLAGGGSLLKGLRVMVHQAVGLEVRKSEDPLRAVIRGAGSVTEHFEYYRDVFMN